MRTAPSNRRLITINIIIYDEKNTFFTIVALTACLYLSAQGVYGGQDCHNLRSGDVVEKQQIGYKEASRSGENVLWNIGDIEVIRKRKRI